MRRALVFQGRGAMVVGAAGLTRTLAAKVIVPVAPPATLRRHALEGRLEGVLDRRLTTVVASAGYGKSTLLAGWATGVHCTWYTVTAEDRELTAFVRGVVHALRLRLPGLPTDISTATEGLHGPDAEGDELLQARAAAGLLSDALAERMHRGLVLVLDDAHELGSARASALFVDALCREAPAAFHVVLASRAEPPFSVERLRGQGHVLEITGPELAFTAAETAALMASALGGESADLAVTLHEATGGWPAAVRLAIEALRSAVPSERVSTLERLCRPQGPLFSYIAAEVFDREPPAVRKLIRTVAPLEGFTRELCEALGVHRAADTLDSLARRGLFLELGRGEHGWFSLSVLVRDFAREYRPLDPSDLQDVRLRAAAWLETHGHVEEALRLLTAADDYPGIARVLHERGRDLLRAGAPESVIRTARLLPVALRDAAVDELDGAARQIRGDWEGALACFRRVASDRGPLTAGTAWRMGIIHHFRGRLDEALEVYARGELDGSEPRDEALLLAWKASAHWLRGEIDACQKDANRAFSIATAAEDSQALAAAHTVLAMLAAVQGDRGANDSHYLWALEHAERAGDLLQIIRIHTNRASRHLEEGAYLESLAELDQGLRMSELAGFAAFHALGLTNRGEALFRLGRMEEALADLRAAQAVYQRAGSRMVCYPLQKLGDIHRERGDLALARAAYEEAVMLAEQANDVQGLVPSLAGLARVLAAEEPEVAQRLADRAVEVGPGMAHVAALLAAGWVALARGSVVRAAELADQAAAAARSRRDRAGLAEALELHALGVQSSELEVAQLHEALAIWQEIGDPLGQARAELVLARLVDRPDGSALAERAERSLRALGARGHATAAVALRASLDRQAWPAVAIRTLGGFRVLRDGEPVPLVEWQSKKARDLLKILLARRGRPTPRDLLFETLWPEDDPARLANRLSVALATVRAVLDPGKRHSSEYFLASDKSSVRIDLAHVDVDVETFLAEATAGLALRLEPREAEALGRLAAAEAAYAGDFLEEDAYEDWAMPLREDAKALYVQVARALAEDAAAREEHDAAGRYFLRVLERDAFDEQAHLGLVATLARAGRHGEARRFYRRYCLRMDEIGVEPAAFLRAAEV